MLIEREDRAFLPQMAYLTLRSDECEGVWDDVPRDTNAPGSQSTNQPINQMQPILFHD